MPKTSNLKSMKSLAKRTMTSLKTAESNLMLSLWVVFLERETMQPTKTVKANQ